jgi:hypothetical protein
MSSFQVPSMPKRSKCISCCSIISAHASGRVPKAFSVGLAIALILYVHFQILVDPFNHKICGTCIDNETWRDIRYFLYLISFKIFKKE